jgi:hypothetical protein
MTSWASARIWGSNEGRKRFRRDEFHTTAEAVFEKPGKREKAIERLGAREEMHEEINITVRPGFATKGRAEQGEPSESPMWIF